MVFAQTIDRRHCGMSWLGTHEESRLPRMIVFLKVLIESARLASLSRPYGTQDHRRLE